MKRILAALALALAAATSFAATQYPLSLLSTTGSTAGQVPVSTGPSTPAVWGTAGTGLYGLLASPLSQFASTTSAQFAGVVSDETGNGLVVFNNAPTITGATLTGAALNGSLGFTTPASVQATTITASGLISPTSSIGIKGTTAGDNAQAGSDGEFATATSTTGGMASATAQSVGTTILAAGDWDIQCSAVFIPTATFTGAILGVGSVLNTLGPLGQVTEVTATGMGTTILVTPVWRQNITSSTQFYCTGFITFGSGTATMQSLIRARRVR